VAYLIKDVVLLAVSITDSARCDRSEAMQSLMKNADAQTVHVEIASRIEMLDTVQAILAHLSALVSFDDDARHYMSVAVRESVLNAIKHGNKLDESKRVKVEFVLHPRGLEVEVQDEGPGFDPSAVHDPVAEENLLKAYGRGIFFMRSFMDEVAYSFPPGGGTRVTMRKKLPAIDKAAPSGPTSSPADVGPAGCGDPPGSGDWYSLDARFGLRV
jgi:serine/threonine-protein kinase RsbW